MTDQRLSDQLRFLCRDRLAYEQLQAMLAAQQEMAEFLLQQQKEQLQQEHQMEIDNFLMALEEEKREFILLLSYAMGGPLRQVLDMTELLMHEELSYQHYDWLYTLGRNANRLVQVFHEAAGDLEIDLPDQIQLRLPMLGGGMTMRTAPAMVLEAVPESSIDAVAETIPESDQVITDPPEITTELEEVINLETEIINTEIIAEPEPFTEITTESEEVINLETQIITTEIIAEPEPFTEITTESEEVINLETEIVATEIIPHADESIFPILEIEFMENIISVAGKGQPAIEFLLEVISEYINEAPTHMDAIRTAYTEKNISQFVRSICFLRTDAEYLGGLELSHMCRRIEIKLEQEYPFPWHKISLPALEKCFAQTHMAIQKNYEHYKSLTI